MKYVKKRNRLLAGFLEVLLLLELTGFGSDGDSSGGTEKVCLMVWPPSEDQSKSSAEWLQTCCENFAAMHPEWAIAFVYGVADEAIAASAVAQNPEASADVFMYANDNLTVMTDALAPAKFGGKYAEEIWATSSHAMLEKGVVSFSFTNSWYLPSFYVGNGCTLFGDSTQEELGVDFGGENAVEVTNYLIDLFHQPLV